MKEKIGIGIIGTGFARKTQIMSVASGHIEIFQRFEQKLKGKGSRIQKGRQKLSS